MFTQPCFIRKNTPELRKKLEELGYVSCCPFNSRCDAICVFVRDGKSEYLDFKIDDDFEINIKDSYPFVDADTNEALFLALAALRDDTDKNQWFVLDTDWSSINHPQNIAPKGKFILCIKDKWNVDVLEDGSPNPISSRNIPAHKATPQEIIEFFNKLYK